MKKMKLFIGILLIGLILIPQVKIFSQEDKNNSEVSVNESSTAQNNLKKDSFYSVQIDKLSEKFFTRLIIDFIAVLILIRFIYFPNYRKRELFFTFFTFNLIIFMITFLLNKVDMGLGAAFGLFAVFSMLRYRTENISAKDMTYLFLAIAIGLITSISKASAFELCILNSIILLITFFLEGSLFQKKELTQSIQYENIEMIKPDRHNALIMDLKERTGLNIHRVTISKVNFLKDTAMIKLYYYEEEAKIALATSPEIIENKIVNQ